MFTLKINRCEIEILNKYFTLIKEWFFFHYIFIDITMYLYIINKIIGGLKMVYSPKPIYKPCEPEDFNVKVCKKKCSFYSDEYGILFTNLDMNGWRVFINSIVCQIKTFLPCIASRTGLSTPSDEIWGIHPQIITRKFYSFAPY